MFAKLYLNNVVVWLMLKSVLDWMKQLDFDYKNKTF